MKPVWKSKMVWFNAITTLVLMAQLIGELQPELAGFTAGIMGAGNIILRVWFTDTKIEI